MKHTLLWKIQNSGNESRADSLGGLLDLQALTSSPTEARPAAWKSHLVKLQSLALLHSALRPVRPFELPRRINVVIGRGGNGYPGKGKHRLQAIPLKPGLSLW